MEKKELYFILGTRASLIKFFPLLKLFEKENVECVYIDTGQHAASLPDLYSVLELNKPDFKLSKRNSNITTFSQSFFWLLEIFFRFIFYRNSFKENNSICITHADNITAFIGILLAKLSGIKTLHLEAGERTNTLFKPFPEELIRRFCDKCSDVNITMSDIAYKNLINEKNNSTIINVSHSCVVDALKTALELKKNKPNLLDKFAVASVHRIETIYNKERLKVVVDTMIKISKKMRVIFVVHENTKNQMKKYKYWNRLSEHNIEIKAIINYVQFVHILENAQFVMTDGGGLQDETYFLGVPCLLMMDETGKDPHPNVFVSKLSEDLIDSFLKRYKEFASESKLNEHNPSKLIVKSILSLL